MIFSPVNVGNSRIGPFWRCKCFTRHVDDLYPINLYREVPASDKLTTSRVFLLQDLFFKESSNKSTTNCVLSFYEKDSFLSKMCNFKNFSKLVLP